MFVVTAYFNIMKQTMTEWFPSAITHVAESAVSIKRIQVTCICCKFQLSCVISFQRCADVKIETMVKEKSGISCFCVQAPCPCGCVEMKFLTLYTLSLCIDEWSASHSGHITWFLLVELSACVDAAKRRNLAASARAESQLPRL
jgi:hypothetical protein